MGRSATLTGVESSVKVRLIDVSFRRITLWENNKQLSDPETVAANENEREGRLKGVGGRNREY